MTVSAVDLSLYAAALAVLVMTPGPVVVAIVARSLTVGMSASVPLALGVIVGDTLYPLLAIFGLAVIAGVYADFLTLLKYAGAAILIVMGLRLLTGRAHAVDPSRREVRRRSARASFVAGLLVNLGNPKSVLFFMGVLPSFFDIRHVSGADIAAIVAISALVPLCGNMVWAALAARARRVLASARAVRRVNHLAGGMLTGAGAVIAAT